MSTGKGASRVADLAARFQQMMGWVNGRNAGESLRTMHENGLTFPQVITLYALRALGPQPVSAVADHVRLTKGAASQLIEKLVAGGLVSREEGDDRRVRFVALTQKGRGLLERLHTIRAKEWQTTLGALPAGVQERLIAAMDEALAALSASDKAKREENERDQG